MMTKEELRIEATTTVEWESTPIIDRPLFVHAYITGAEPREKHIAELEKENEQLKAKLLQERETYWGKGFNYSKDQPTKAKEIIKNLHEVVRTLNNTNVQLTDASYTLAEAEQFLDGGGVT